MARKARKLGRGLVLWAKVLDDYRWEWATNFEPAKAAFWLDRIGDSIEGQAECRRCFRSVLARLRRLGASFEAGDIWGEYCQEMAPGRRRIRSVVANQASGLN